MTVLFLLLVFKRHGFTPNLEYLEPLLNSVLGLIHLNRHFESWRQENTVSEHDLRIETDCLKREHTNFRIALDHVSLTNSKLRPKSVYSALRQC